MSTLRDIFVDMVPGDRIFLGVIFTSYLTENVLGLQSFVDPMTCMLILQQYFLSIRKQGGGLRNLLVARDHLHRIPTQCRQVGVDAQV